MFISGLASVSFRHLSPKDVLQAAMDAELGCIEWGGDVHVPHGDIAAAKRVRDMMDNSGLVTRAYGSYYRCGFSEREGLSFDSVLDSAVALGAPMIRVWAGNCSPTNLPFAVEKAVQDDAKRIATVAQGYGIKIAFEYHLGTLTETDRSARRFYDAVDHPNVYALWQARIGKYPDQNLPGLRDVLPRLIGVHAFEWRKRDRLPLAEGMRDWMEYLRECKQSPNDIGVMLEFVKDNSIAQLKDDAATLNSWLKRLND